MIVGEKCKYISLKSWGDVSACSKQSSELDNKAIHV